MAISKRSRQKVAFHFFALSGSLETERQRTDFLIIHTMKSKMVILTEQLIRAGMKSGCGLKRQQIKVLGETMPLKAGWLERAIGKEITEDKYKWFLKCMGDEYLKPKKRKRKKQKTA